MEQPLRDRRQFWPTQLLVAPDAVHDPLTERVISRLKGHAEIHFLEERGDPLRSSGGAEVEADEVQRFNRGKRQLMLTRHQGAWLKACPGTSGHVCCNLWIVNPGEGCPLDCTYCYLQTYLKRNPTLKLYTNTDAMLQEIGERASREPNRLFRVGTGELMDSLVWDDLTDLTLELVPFFARSSNLVLELKSKDSYVENLLALRDEHQGKTVVSWSVNAREVSERDEAYTATLEQRLKAASLVAEAGYRVGLHFDPLVHFDGWEDGYRDVIREIFSVLSPRSIAWISISSLRYKPELQEMMMARFPQSRLPFGEQFLAKDRKIRYVQPLRFQMIDFVHRELKAVDEQMPVYFCMESAAAWRHVTGGLPAAGSELTEVFSRKGRLPILTSDNELTCG